MQGYMDAAKAFEEESGTSCGPVTATAMDRMAIRSAVERGQLVEAIERVNDLNPEVTAWSPSI
jgi:glucose-induced degradation protein 8